MDYRINEVIKLMKMLDESVKKMPMAKLNQTAVAKGLSSSANVCKQEEVVFATPWMKNLLITCGDVSQHQDDKGVWHTDKFPVGKESRAVNLVNQWVEAALTKFNGPKRDSYDETKPIGDIDHYFTDCWLGWKPKVWDIQEGQAEERRKVLLGYGDPDTNFSVKDMINAIQKDKALQKAILIALETLPEVRASREVRAISDPFMSKGSGVSYPDYANDRTALPDQDMTYGKYEIELVKQALDKGDDYFITFLYMYNVYTAYPRNQRGKGRALEAQSRRNNLGINLLNSIEMEKWKESDVLGTAFQDEAGIKASLVKKAEWIEKHPLYCARNEDTSGWDRSVGSGWVTLSAAVRYLRANGTFSKRLVEVRHNCVRKSYLVDGPNKKVHVLYGRTPSGDIDTTLLNSSIHRILSTAALLSIDPHYSENVIYPTNYQYEDIVGDDFDGIFIKGEEAKRKFREYYKKYGFTIHSDEKSIYGVMFIQYRIFRHPETNNWVMVYNWPRVFRSMLSKESAKQLGIGGWTLSAYQQLGKCIEYEDVKIPLNLICACDQYKLHLDTPIEEIKRMVKEEDQARLQGVTEDKKRRQKATRILTTAERLSNNPTLPGTREVGGKVEIDWDYFGSIQEKLKTYYDKDFLVKLGFKNPDLSAIH